MTSYSPLVGLPADTYENGGFLFHSLGDKYLRAVAEVAQCTPVMIPCASAAPVGIPASCNRRAVMS
mgnify:CR=1 FL=1